MSRDKHPSSLRWQNSDTDKRAKHLERNRTAASKSRQKKKRETSELQSRFQEVSHKRSSLDNEIKTLHRQLLSLKDQILLHSRCEDEAIHLYLSGMVKQATKRDSISSTADELDVGDPRNSASPSGDTVGRSHRYANSPGHNLSGLESPHPQHISISMGDTRDLLSGVKDTGMTHEMFSQPTVFAANRRKSLHVQLGIS
ncbi:bZIP transcription factor [Aspergillus undulatus]|uniref:bZIP transcription factor n=1 Tax=Aspergillus undulatus TaxID=1810928 RepID=UPI003CCD3743